LYATTTINILNPKLIFEEKVRRILNFED